MPADPAKRAEYYRKTKAAFLVEYEKRRHVIRAARAVKVDPVTIYYWAKKDPEFQQKWDDVKEIVRNLRNDEIRDELKRRGIEGWIEPVFQGGKRVGSYRKYSDVCLVKLASANLPEHREKLDVGIEGKVEHTHRLEPNRFAEEYAGPIEAVIRRRAIARESGDGNSN